MTYQASEEFFELVHKEAVEQHSTVSIANLPNHLVYM